MSIPTFWGLTVEPKRKYKQTVDLPFTISSVALGLDTHAGNTSLLIEVDGSEPHVVCTLNQDKWPQHHCGVKLNEGQDISIYSVGTSTIHLTGYQEILLEDEDLDDDELDGYEFGEECDDLEEDSDDEEVDSDGFEDIDDDEDEDEEEEEDGKPKFVEIEEPAPEAPASAKRKAEVKESSAKKAKNEPKAIEHKPVAPKQEAKKEKETPKQESKAAGDKQQKAGKQMKLEGGTMAEDVVVGTGVKAKPGKHVGVYYVGRTAHNNKIFDACQSGKPFKFNLGRGEVIKGWDIGVNGMQVGGKRVLRIPPNQAYGPRGHPPVIPGNATLIFEVELKYVK